MSGIKEELIALGVTTLEQGYHLVTDLDESRGSYFHRTVVRESSKTTTTNKPSYDQSFPAQSKPTSSFTSVKLASSTSANPTTFKKRTTSELVKVNPRSQYYRCQGYVHYANRCLCQARTLLVEVPIEEE